jgi:NADP-dependent 3-hydroxy acid dehydrogenase YdfG
MVSLASITESNSRISTLPPGLVAIFIGATAGIGEITLKKFAQHARQPRAYVVGRSQSAADRIIDSCREINPEGEYVFIKADVSLIINVDEVCEVIKAREKTINILFLSAGLPVLDCSGTQTSSLGETKKRKSY